MGFSTATLFQNGLLSLFLVILISVNKQKTHILNACVIQDYKLVYVAATFSPKGDAFVLALEKDPENEYLDTNKVFNIEVQQGECLKAKAKSQWQPLPEGASTMQVMFIPEVDEHSIRFDEMTKEDLINISKFIEQSNKTIEVENKVIERFLTRIDPNILVNMKQVLEAAAIAFQKAERASLLGGSASSPTVSKETGSGGNTDTQSSSMDTSTTRSGSSYMPKMGLLGFSDKGPKIQLAQKIEIVNREIDELKNVLESFRNQARKYNNILWCRTEEMSGRLQEIVDAQNEFETKLLVDGVDPITGKLPGEKFIRYMEIRLKAEEMEIDKLRVKTGSLRSYLKKLKEQLAQKEELGEVLHSVDFEQLQIENQECQEQLDYKAAQLIRLKIINGKFGNILNIHKKRLNEQMNKLTQLQQTAVVKEKMIKSLVADEEKIKAEAKAVEKTINKITNLMQTYTVPDVLSYIHKKVEVQDLKKEIKICERKHNIQDLTLTSALAKLKSMHDGFSRRIDSNVNFTSSRIFF